MIPARSQTELLQQKIVELLKADAAFAALATYDAIITEDVKDVNAAIVKALVHLKCGSALIIMTPSMNTQHENTPGPLFDLVEIYVQCLESPLINRSSGTKKTASYWAERVAHCLHQKQGIQNKTITCAGIQLLEDPELLVYRVRLKTMFGLSVKPTEA